MGHTFLLGTRYSAKLGATYLSNGKPLTLQMCCFGLGITRILAAALEAESENNQLRWPFKLAPYSVIIIPPKDGSKEESAVKGLVEELYRNIELVGFKSDVIVDDRGRLTIGKRVLEAKKFGYPLIIVVGNDAAKEVPIFELHNLRDKVEHNLNKNDLINYLAKLK